MKKLTIILISFVLTLLLVGCKNQGDSIKESSESEIVKTISVRLPIPVVDGAFAPFYIAQDKGFFKKHGLEVNLEPGFSELNPVKMVDSNQDEIGILGGPELAMTASNNGANIKAFALLHKNSNFASVITKKESGITTVQQLEGLNVGFFYGHISTDVLRSLFQQEGIKVNETDEGFNYSRFIANQIPAQWAFTTTAGINLPAKGIDINIISPSDYGIITHGYTFIADSETFKNDKSILQSFLAATIEATEYSIANREESIQSVLNRTNDLNRETVSNQLDLYEAAIKNNERIGWFTNDLFDDTRNRMVELGILTQTYSLEETFDNSLISNYYESIK